MTNKNSLERLLPELPGTDNSNPEDVTTFLDSTSTLPDPEAGAESDEANPESDLFKFVKDDLAEFVEDESIAVLEKMKHLLELSEFISGLAVNLRDNNPESALFDTDPDPLSLDDPDQDPDLDFLEEDDEDDGDDSDDDEDDEEDDDGDDSDDSDDDEEDEDFFDEEEEEEEEEDGDDGAGTGTGDDSNLEEGDFLEEDEDDGDDGDDEDSVKA